MELQHVNVRLYLEDSRKLDVQSLIPVFHRWIQEQVCAELLIDVADYRHVYAGPGVVLVGHEADYSVDNSGNRLSVRYNRKVAVAGSNQDRFKQAVWSALTACQRLEADSILRGQLRFDRRHIQLFINDRILAPNQNGTYATVKPELDTFFAKLFGGATFSLYHDSDPRSLFSLDVEASGPFDPGDLLRNLS